LWTATGDDADTGRAARYDLRYSTNGVGADIGSWWNAASRAAGLPAPSYAGQIDSTRVAGLIPETDYTFVLRVIDEAGNASPFSNVLVATTGPGTDASLPLPSVLLPTVHAYPNPAQDQVHFVIHVPDPAGDEVRLRLFDMTGKVVADLAQGSYPEGDTIISWPRVAWNGDRVAPGYYESIGTIGDLTVRERVVLLP
ncbi:MAG TPA: hypothetical protein VFD83_05000, partial [Candidatus Polarisedimenticolia bacterium]|nr:hypothetical protein [Candidatus Polarisedimenticolia bacterium]